MQLFAPVPLTGVWLAAIVLHAFENMALKASWSCSVPDAAPGLRSRFTELPCAPPGTISYHTSTALRRNTKPNQTHLRPDLDADRFL